jgi:hypothetical protein
MMHGLTNLKLGIYILIRSDEIVIVIDNLLFFFHNFAYSHIILFFVLRDLLDHLQFCCGFVEKLDVCNKLNSTTSVYLNAYYRHQATTDWSAGLYVVTKSNDKECQGVQKCRY